MTWRHLGWVSKGAYTCEASSDNGEQTPGGSRVPSGVISLAQSHSRIARALVVVMMSTWTHPWIYTRLVSASETASWFEWPQCVDNIQQDVLDEPWSRGTYKALCFPRTTWRDEDRLNCRGLDGQGRDLKHADWTFCRIIKVCHIRPVKLQSELVFLAGGSTTGAISILGGGATSGFRNFQNFFFFLQKRPNEYK